MDKKLANWMCGTDAFVSKTIEFMELQQKINKSLETDVKFWKEAHIKLQNQFIRCKKNNS